MWHTYPALWDRTAGRDSWAGQLGGTAEWAADGAAGGVAGVVTPRLGQGTGYWARTLGW
jgi:hypothetical protein